jgi:glycosyltransferase involved in cell wall biosynthesis
MKYPFIIYYKQDSNFENFLILNGDYFNCTIFITDDINQLNKMYNNNYPLLITYGVQEENNNLLVLLSDLSKYLCQNILKYRHVHFTEVPTVESFNLCVNRKFIEICTLERELVRPTFSIFTTTFNSYNKIIRAYNSILNQTLLDWEWVIIDDSPDDQHFAFLKNMFIKDSHDSRIRLYKRSENSGNIGNVKNEAISLCRGKYVLEMDHDDEILADTLQDSATYFDANPEVGFIYMDFINIYENGNNFKYGDFICKGYGSYYCQKYCDKWVYVYNTPNINNITLSHLVCCPNHPRIWRKDALMKAGNYSEYLPICDDYEILLRTALTTKMAKISKLAYVQYMNDSNNNFSLIRNGEINRIGPHFIRPIFYEKFQINDTMKTLDAYENEDYIWHHSKLWKRDDTYEHKYCNNLVNMDYDRQYCIVGTEALNLHMISIQELYINPRNDFILLDNCIDIQKLFDVLENCNFDRFKCYTLNDCTYEELEKYFKRMYLSCKSYTIFTNEDIKNYDK